MFCCKVTRHLSCHIRLQNGDYHGKSEKAVQPDFYRRAFRNGPGALCHPAGGNHTGTNRRSHRRNHRRISHRHCYGGQEADRSGDRDGRCSPFQAGGSRVRFRCGGWHDRGLCKGNHRRRAACGRSVYIDRRGGTSRRLRGGLSGGRAGRAGRRKNQGGYSGDADHHPMCGRGSRTFRRRSDLRLYDPDR